ncbi:SurA N-terminal domain-containing protein [Candidatus Curtissbacteria bacterium]|nr:SurA N-terminal domain-containing protein [Candidatus Curtissbacteria bacterium]
MFGLILIGIPLAAYLVAREQKTDKSEVGQVAEETVVAIINGQKITKADVRKVAEEQYSPSAVNDQALKDALDTLSERMILDEESKRLQISADPQEISEKIEAESFTQTQARYEVLKEKVTLKEVKNWQVFVIGFWVPPNDQREDLTEEELADIKKILSDGLLVLNEAGKLMSSDQEVVEIARSLISKYPKLEKVLGVNGYLLAQAQDSGDLTNLTSPKVYTYQSSNIGQPLFDTIYSMKTPGEVKKALSENDSGGNVIKLVGGNTNVRFNTYEDWLKDKKNEMVEIVIPL